MTEGRTIAIASGKGGVGKTWFAITLAHALARHGSRVLLFDADLGLANVDIQLGLTPKQDLGGVIAGRATLADAILHQTEGGFAIVAGHSGSGALSGIEPAALERVLAALHDETGHYDMVLLDLGAGLDRAVRRMSAWADTMLVLATDEPTSSYRRLCRDQAVLHGPAAGRCSGRGQPGRYAPSRPTDVRHFGARLPDFSRPRPQARRHRAPRRQGARRDTSPDTVGNTISNLARRHRRGGSRPFIVASAAPHHMAGGETAWR